MDVKSVSRYNLHDLCVVDIIDNTRGLARRAADVEGRYQCFRAVFNADVPADLVVRIGNFEPEREGCAALDGCYFIKDGYLCHMGETYKLGASWRFDASGLESDRIELRIAANWLGRPFIAGKLIDFFIFYTLLRKGVSLMHASAVAQRGKARVFGARGGGGKSTLALAAAFEAGMTFLGDNFILLKEGLVYGYLSDLNMFGYNLHPRIWQVLTPGEKAQFRFWAAVHRLTLGYIKVFSPVSPLRFVPEAPLAAVRLGEFNFLQTGLEYGVQPLDRAGLTARMASNMKLEFMAFVRHSAAYGCLFPRSAFAQLWKQYEAVFAANLPADAVCQLVTVPERMTDEVKKQVLSAEEGAG